MESDGAETGAVARGSHCHCARARKLAYFVPFVQYLLVFAFATLVQNCTIRASLRAASSVVDGGRGRLWYTRFGATCAYSPRRSGVNRSLWSLLHRVSPPICLNLDHEERNDASVTFVSLDTITLVRVEASVPDIAQPAFTIPTLIPSGLVPLCLCGNVFVPLWQG